MKPKDQAARVLQSAREWIGTPYIHQASLKGVGCDCLGLVRGVWRDVVGGEPTLLPAYSSSWSEVSNKEQLLEAADKYFIPGDTSLHQPGDLLVFRMRRNTVAKHLGIVSSHTSFIHAYDNNAVVESALSDFWLRRIVGRFQFPINFSVEEL